MIQHLLMPTYGTAAIDEAWDIAFFPTVYMICRDHLVHSLTQPTPDEAYAAVLAGCPSTAPSSTYDVKATGYSQVVITLYVMLRLRLISQNYSQTNAVTTATVTVTDGSGATVATVPWTGSLAPYAVTSVSVPSFAGTSLGGYQFSVTTSGDSNPGDDVSADSLFKVYAASNATALPFFR